MNQEKCFFGQARIKFLGHVLDKEGVSPDPERTTALTRMAAPSNITELHYFLGMANQLGKFTPKLAELTQPLRELLSSKSVWDWSPSQEKAFQDVKTELTKPNVLELYYPSADTKISADVSSYGIGAVLLQKHQSSWKPTAFTSCSLSKIEHRCAQIEKQALAVTWSCDKFSNYILGKRITLGDTSQASGPTSGILTHRPSPTLNIEISTSSCTIQLCR